jgi:IS5 family transposase
VIVERKSKAILATAFAKGRTHDFQLFKDSRSALAKQTCGLGDTGYQGLVRLHPNSQPPLKKSKYHPLTKEDKAYNRALARERILVEHVIRALKIFRILSERYRNRRKRFALRFNLIAALYNSELETPT